MPKRAAGKGAKPARNAHIKDVEMTTDPITQTLPPAQIADGADDPMADPQGPQETLDEEDEGMFEPELSSEDDDAEAGEEEDDDHGLEEASNISADEEEDASDLDMDDGGGAPLTSRESLSPSRIPMINAELASQADSTLPTSIHVEKPTPYIHDAGHLLITDPNPLPTSTPATLEATLTATARDAAQSLLNHLLTTCPIHSLSTTSTSTSGVEMTLPHPTFPLPREKKIPAPKAPTKWELFAAKKGIGQKGSRPGSAKPGDEKRAGKMVYDEASGEWVPKWGYKGKNKQGEGDWIVEVDEKKEAALAAKGKGGVVRDAGAIGRAERKERVKRNERAQRANERRGRKNGA